ncbi:MAG: hypothetical protein V8Q43_04235 [Christensenellaceae bacterium]
MTALCGATTGACRARLSAIDPDIVINSHYELLDCIPPRLLPRTINHFHTSFGQVLELKSYQATFRRYQNKIGKFVWLSHASCEAAKRFGLENSCCIYNPIAFSSEQTADLSVHRALFLGRFSPEKAAQHRHFPIPRGRRSRRHAVGIGHLWRGRIGRRLGGTDCRRFPRPLSGEHLHAARSLFAAQSVFDDFPFRGDAVGGIRSCGMRAAFPTIAMDFGETAPEVVLNGRTGILLPAGAKEAYAAELTCLLDRPDLREELGAGAKQYAAGFALPAITAQWFSLFQNFLSKEHPYDKPMRHRPNIQCRTLFGGMPRFAPASGDRRL